MIEVTVKTLDSQNHSFSVPPESTVKEFKEQISPVLNISVEKQRLIFCGKVLKDDKKLKDYNVDGKVIHVVQSLPPQGNNASSSSPSANSTGGGSRAGHRDAAGFVLGAFTIPQDLIDPTQVQNIVQEVVSGMGEIGRNATVMSRTSDDGSSVDVHINLGQIPLQSEAQLRMNRAQTMLIRANRLLESLEDGTNSNNGGNSADSSSQTDNENDELRSSPIEAEIDNNGVSDNDVLNNGSDESTLINGTPIDESPDIPPQINLVTEVSGRAGTGPERYRFEGLAHAAQAAISAAFATAAAAARAATASISPSVMANNTDSDNRRLSEPDAMGSRTDAAESISSAFLNLGAASGNIASGDASTIPMESEASAVSECDSFAATLQHEENKESKPESTANSGAQSSDTPAPGTASTSGSIPTRRETVQPSVQTLANLLDEVIRVNSRLEPCLERCRDLIRSDPPLSGRKLGDAHRLFNRISQLLHFLSHAFHSLSDLHVNFSQTPPRSPRVRLISSTPASSILHGIPVQAQISISTSSNVVPSSSQSTTTTANSANNDGIPSSTTDSRPVPTVPASVGNARGDSTTAAFTTTSAPVSSVLRNQNPVVFMEVSPGTITIDSISTVDAAVSSTTGTSQAPSSASARENSVSSQTEPPEDGQASGRTNNTNISMPSFSAQGHPMINIPFRNIIPVPLTSMGSLHTFDSGLPCHSVWALEPSRRRHNAGGSRTAQGVTPNAPGRQDEQLQHVINSMMSLLNQSTAQGQVGSQVIPGLTLMSPSNAGEYVRRGRLFIDRERNARERSTRDRSARPSSNDTVPGSADATPRSSPSMDNEVFNRLIEEVMTSAAGHHSISNVLSFLNPSFDEEDIIGNFVWFIAGELSFHSLLEISLGNYQSLTLLKEPLQRYIREKVFHSERPQPNEIEPVVQQISDDLAALLYSFMGAFTVQNGIQHSIDYRATMSSFFKQSIPKLLDVILNPPENASESFGKILFEACKKICLEFLFLQNHCIENGAIILERIVVQRIDSVASSPQFSSSQLRLALIALASRLIINSSSSERNYETVLSHIVTAPATDSTATIKNVKQNVNGTTKMSDASSKSSKDTATNHFRRNENINGDVRSSESLSTDIAEGRAAPTLAAIARFAERTSAILRNSSRASDNLPVAEVVIGSEAWHSTLPRDWVPIIARDVQRQRRQAPQAPFSNAYLSGVPSKRRKIMTTGASTLLGQSQNTFTEMLLQAISNADVQPVTSIEEVQRDAYQDEPIHTAFNTHMKNVIQERLQRDLDYCSERFPNAEKYYNIERL